MLLKIPETWYLLLLALCLVGYIWAFFYFYNQLGSTGPATLCFGLAVFTALLSRFLFARWQQNRASSAFSWLSLALVVVGLLVAGAAGLGYLHLRQSGSLPPY